MYRYLLAIVLLLLQRTSSTVVTLSGGQITINGAITASYLDLYLNFSANVQWVAMIWSQNQADTDVTLFQLNPNNPARPVTLTDCYLDQNSYIQSDNVQNLQTSVTGFTGDTSYGLKAAFKRDLATSDSQDITIYSNSVIQVCFIASTAAFVGNGEETGNEKNCAYLSLHKETNYWQDRLLGNFAGTTTFGGGNLTVYATESTDGATFQSWLFLTVVHKAQGLSSFSPKWIGVLYNTTQINSDMAVLQYSTQGIQLDIHIDDFYVLNSSFANYDLSYVLVQGSNDVEEVMSSYDATAYFVGSYKRKFSTGDTNRDSVVINEENTFCLVLGDAQAFSGYSVAQTTCFTFNLGVAYSSNFRETSSTSMNVQNYVAPSNNVVVVKWEAVCLLSLVANMVVLLIGVLL